MCAVGEILGGGGKHVRVVVRVVENEGDLRVQVRATLAVAELAHEGLDVSLCQTYGHTLHGTGEGLVCSFDTRVDNLDDLFVTLLCALVCSGHLQGGGVLQTRVHRADFARRIVVVHDQRLEVALDEGGLDARSVFDGLEAGGGGTDRKSVECMGVVGDIGDVGTGDRLLDRGLDAILDRLMLGLGGEPENPAIPRNTDTSILQRDDDRCRGVVGTLGHSSRVRIPGLVGCTGLEPVARLRLTRPGLGILGSADGDAGRLGFLLGEGRRGIDCGRGEGAGHYQRQCHDGTMGHLWLT